MDMGTHRFDLMAYLFGPALQVRCIHGTQSLATDVEDAATMALEFAEQVHGSAEFHWNCPVERDTFTIVGTEGILSTDSLSNAGRLTLESPSGRETWRLPASAPVHLNLVQAFVDHFAAQCGYCTPGMLMAAKALLDKNPNPSREDVTDALGGNICRCTGYEPIIEAVLTASKSSRGGA